MVRIKPNFTRKYLRTPKFYKETLFCLYLKNYTIKKGFEMRTPRTPFPGDLHELFLLIPRGKYSRIIILPKESNIWFLISPKSSRKKKSDSTYSSFLEELQTLNKSVAKYFHMFRRVRIEIDVYIDIITMIFMTSADISEHFQVGRYDVHCTVLHMFAQVLFLTENHGNQRDWIPFMLLHKLWWQFSLTLCNENVIKTGVGG